MTASLARLYHFSLDWTVGEGLCAPDPAVIAHTLAHITVHHTLRS